MGNAWDSFLDRCRQHVLTWDQQHLRRHLAAAADGTAGLYDLSHNDYLGLRHDPSFQAACQQAAAAWPVGAGASRLLGGEWSLFAQVEEAFAAFKGGESALYLSSGYAANEAIATVLAEDPDVGFFSDRLNHASTVDGLRLAIAGKTQRVQRYRHGDHDDLARRLLASPWAVNYIFSETLFSMDGDVADLAALWQLAQQHRGVLVLDEAHATGVYGARGEGLIHDAGLDPARLISISTCGKALGVQGAFVVGPKLLRERLINRARPFIFSTGPSPWLLAALQVAIPYVAGLHDRRARLHQQASQLRHALAALGFVTEPSSSFIVPVLCGDNVTALALAAHLQARGIVAKAIRSPTVLPGTERVRLSWHAALPDAAVEHVVAAFRDFPPPVLAKEDET